LIPGEMLADNNFYPNQVVTRGEFIAIIAKLSQNTVGNISISFQDVKESDYYYPAVKWGVGSGIVRGVSDTAFSPKSSVSRQDAAAILYRYLTSQYASQYAVNWTAVKTKEAFADDGAIAGYAKEAVYAVQAGGIITGRTDGRFDPQAGITRAELTVILSRILDTRKS
jgi:endo-1,4-beta-xylanase